MVWTYLLQKLVYAPKLSLFSWVWNQGSIKANSHRVATQASCPPQILWTVHAHLLAHMDFSPDFSLFKISITIRWCFWRINGLKKNVCGQMNSSKLVSSQDSVPSRPDDRLWILIPSGLSGWAVCLSGCPAYLLMASVVVRCTLLSGHSN